MRDSMVLDAADGADDADDAILLSVDDDAPIGYCCAAGLVVVVE
jgi:hypothetical protein